MTILLTPARIGGVAIKNRIVMPPMTTRTADDDGCVTADTIADDVARANGGVGGHHRGDGVAGEGRAPSRPRARHL